MKIALDKIDTSYFKNSRQRLDMGEFNALRAALASAGENFVPVLLAPHPDATKAKTTPYALFDGWGRYACAADLKWEALNAELKEGLSLEQIEDWGFTANVARRALTAAEQCDFIGARATNNPETGKKAASVEELSKRLGLAKQTVENYVRLYKAPFYKGWHAASVQNKPVPSSFALNRLLTEIPAKEFKGPDAEKERNAKLCSAYGKLARGAEEKVAAKSEATAAGKGKGKKAKGDGHKRPPKSRQSAGAMQEALATGRKLIRDIEAGTAAPGWKASDVPMIEQVVATLEWATKKKGATLLFSPSEE